jgi:hypothetical protein
MSRRSQSRRRRSFGRRQHELRERRPGGGLDLSSSDRGSRDDQGPAGRPADAGGEQEAAGA